MICDNLIFDGNNMCQIHFHGNKGADDDTYIGITFFSVLNSMKFIFGKFKPKNVVIAFDESSWRKLYTDDLSKCITHKKYKGTRRQNKTPKELERLEKLDLEMKSLRDMFKNHTAMIVLNGTYLEADDLIAGFIQERPNENHVIVSSDKDFMQLLEDNVKLYNPIDNKFRTLGDWNNDAKYFLFEKCIRGDAGDNVMSSYPKIRSTRILKAYTDEFELNNIMNNEFVVEEIDKNGELKTHKYLTKDVFEENIHLMDLNNQPEYIRELMKKTIDTAIDKRGKFSLFHFLKFCGKYELNTVIKNVENFTPLLR